MAVTTAYLTKIRRCVRRNSSVDIDAELTEIIESGRLELQSVGILSTKANDENDGLVLNALKCYARWKFGVSNEEAEQNKNDFYDSREGMRYQTAYTVAV